MRRRVYIKKAQESIKNIYALLKDLGNPYIRFHLLVKVARVVLFFCGSDRK